MHGNQVITRFAPSPTGLLHVGGARTALYNWAYARHHQGRFLLRLEDTDQKRSSEAAADAIQRDLKWLGLNWDNDPIPRQSQRLDFYNEQIERLLGLGYAYVPEDEPQIVRFGMYEDVSFHDAVYGDIQVKASELEDFVIRKSDGFPTFHLAVVVDDALMGITHVIRGQEHLTNTTKHVALQDALGFTRPTYAHTPSIMNPNGSKMSKRDAAKVARQAKKHWGDQSPTNDVKLLAQKINPNPTDPEDSYVRILEDFLGKERDDESVALDIAKVLKITLPEINVIDFRMSGYLPEVLCNYIALLGWNPGNDIEKFDRQLLSEHFNLERIGKSNARFDRQKLLAFNADAIGEMPADRFEENLRHHFKLYRLNDLHRLGDQFPLLAASYQERSHTLDEPAVLGRFFFLDDDEIEYDHKAVKKVLEKNDGEGYTVLTDILAVLEACSEWATQAIDAAIKTFAEQKGFGLGKVAQPLRVAVSGITVSPPIDATLCILGKNATMARIKKCLKLHWSSS